MQPDVAPDPMIHAIQLAGSKASLGIEHGDELSLIVDRDNKKTALEAMLLQLRLYKAHPISTCSA